MASHVTVTDKGYRAMRARMRELKLGVKVGIYGEEASKPHGKLTNVEVAAVHEFGSGPIPERSFVRATVDGNRAEIEQIERRVVYGIIQGKVDAQTGLGILGESVVNMMKARIRAHIPPPLKPATIKRKGSSTPLIDTGQLINSIAWTTTTRSAA